MTEPAKASVREFASIVHKLLPSLGKSLIAFSCFALLYELVKLVPIYLLKLLVDAVVANAPIRDSLILLGGILVCLIALVIIERFFFGRMARLAVEQERELLNRMFTKLVSLPLAWHEKEHSGALINKTTKASKAVNELIWMLGDNIIPTVIQIVVTGALLIWVDWRIGLVYLICTTFLIKLIDIQFRTTQVYRERYHKAREDGTRELAQGLTNVQTVKDYAQERREGAHHASLLNLYVSEFDLRVKHEDRIITFRNIFMSFARVGTMVLAIYLLENGELTVGSLVLVFTLIEKAYLNLYRLGRVYSFMGDTHESLSRALAVQEAFDALPDTGKAAFTPGALVLDNVTFAYGRQKVLQDISVTFPAGKVTAIVGPSGAGKTTLVKLLKRHYDPTKGSVTIGGTDLRNLPLVDVRGRIAFVSQHTEIFDRTVAENISYGRPKASRAEIIAAAKRANAHEFIMGFTDGYDTVVGERGIRLSGGQRQRVSIARAILADPAVIIFDEATSSLDSESERAIQKAVFSIKGKTLIIIAHRFSTIEHADGIVVLKDGRVAETGTHKELMKKKIGIYKRMRSLQKLGELRA